MNDIWLIAASISTDTKEYNARIAACCRAFFVGANVCAHRKGV
jgi:hypothetical protein